MKKLVSVLLMCGMVSTMVASSCWASDSDLNGVVSKFANEVVVEKLTKTEAQNNYSDNYSDNYTNAKPTEITQEEVTATDAYFKELAEKSGKPEDDFVKGKFEEFKEKLSGINRDSLKEFIKKHGLKVALAVCAVIAAVCGGVALKKLDGANSVTKGKAFDKGNDSFSENKPILDGTINQNSVGLGNENFQANFGQFPQPILSNINNENYAVFDNLENKANTFLSEESSSLTLSKRDTNGGPLTCFLLFAFLVRTFLFFRYDFSGLV